MKTAFPAVVLSFLLASGVHAQTAAEKPHPGNPLSSEAQDLRADIDRLKVILNQMRNNLAFVQTSQTPLKHQFELETDAWQVIIEQMDKRLKAIEERNSRELAHSGNRRPH
jgi:outer membrane murein-binding lipoprotein Lpp